GRRAARAGHFGGVSCAGKPHTNEKAARRAPPPRHTMRTGPNALALPDVAGLQALRPLHDLELDALPFGERLETLSLDRGEVNEHVLATFLRDEAKTLRIVEPLHGTRCHR